MKTINTNLFAECSLTKLNLVAAGVLLASVGASFGQSTIQFSTTSCAVAENAGAVTLMVQRQGDRNTVVSVDYTTADGTATNR